MKKKNANGNDQQRQAVEDANENRLAIKYGICEMSIEALGEVIFERRLEGCFLVENLHSGDEVDIIWFDPHDDHGKPDHGSMPGIFVAYRFRIDDGTLGITIDIAGRKAITRSRFSDPHDAFLNVEAEADN